ncbi:MAG: HlyD family efflux transporter periplasmic adaptor subunit [Proteobacteria bacterium]|nr:HlyD family efflux transporter periplasmic adaptor subunit [Pseudomonadota bacterium]
MSESNAPAPAPAAAAPAAPAADAGNPARKKALTAVAAAVVVAGAAYGAYWALVLNHYESTDNAYVQGNLVQLTPQISGTVVAIGADDTDHVKAGQVLVKLDPADAQVALDQAEAQLAQTVREVRTTFANNSTLKAQIALREADAARAQSDLIRAQDDVTRRQPLLQTGAVGKEEFNHATAQVAAARSQVTAAQSAVVAAREQLASNQTLTEGVSVEEHPNVLRAAARVREAYLALHRAELLSPVDGYVAKRSVQLGQRVPAGAPLMSVIALNQVWVEANFKESQLKNLRIGQPVTLEADMYGKKVEYHGKVEGLGAGTGAAFALLPAQNATGNWIKVVQRVPVRIALDAKELVDHPLRVGLSMDATVDIHDTNGAMLADGTRHDKTAQTDVFAMNDTQADAEVRKIIAANGGRAANGPAQVSRNGSAAGTKGVTPAVAAAAGSISTIAQGSLQRTTAMK